MSNMLQEQTVMCRVHQLWYECHGIPMKLYFVTLYVSAVLTGLYILASSYNLLWLLVPHMGGLGSIMRLYRNNRRKAAGESNCGE